MNEHDDQIILINKPLKWTSFDVVKKVRNSIKVKKVGHAGTLDPMATGLLILCTGKLTKQISNYQNLEKEYTGNMIIGKNRPSHDLETDVVETNDISSITEQQVKDIISNYRGEIEQIPPMHSAIKINGKRLYLKARKGIEVPVKPRTIQIKEFQITEIDFPLIHFKVVCSKGTYIRSLVRDVGKDLKVGAYLNSLKRTRIGDFSLNDALDIESFIKKVNYKEE